MFRIIFIVVLSILTFSLSGFSQAADQEVPYLNFMLSSEKTSWKQGEPAVVKAKIEYPGGRLEAVNVPQSISFKVESKKREFLTSKSKVFWSPVSLTKNYQEKASKCQNDLTEDRVKNGSISPPANDFRLKKGESKEFIFNLAATCWNQVMLSDYPKRELFSLTGTGNYIIYFEMEFRAGQSVSPGILVPRHVRIKSNEIEIDIN